MLCLDYPCIKYVDKIRFGFHVGLHILITIFVVVVISEYVNVTNFGKNVFTKLKEKAQLQCTYKKNVTVYMDSFEAVAINFFGKQYQKFLSKSRQCEPLPGGGRCFFHHDHDNDSVFSSDAKFYYAPENLNFQRAFLDQIIVAFTMEPERNRLPPSKQYDIKISYKRNSTIPKPAFCSHYDKKSRMLRLAEMGQPDVPMGRKNLVAAFISNCQVRWRNNYLTKLMKYIHIDNWGKCLHNTPGDFWKTRRMNFEKTKLDLLKNNPYKFLIAFENTVDPDYVTEKIYHAYFVRAIPIYYGDKAVFDFVPANTSLIYANNYSPKELAALIQRISNNDTLYSQYFTNWDLKKLHKLHEKYCSVDFICATCREVWRILYKRKCAMHV